MMTMKITLLPKTQLGKWSVGLTIFFLLLITTFVICVYVLKIPIFVSDWWNSTALVAFLNLTILIAFPLDIIAFFTGIRAVRKNKERSVLVFLSILIGLCVILFLIFHSLFIND